MALDGWPLHSTARPSTTLQYRPKSTQCCSITSLNWVFENSFIALQVSSIFHKICSYCKRSDESFPMIFWPPENKIPFAPQTSLTAIQDSHHTVRVSTVAMLAQMIYPFICPLLPEISIKRREKESSVEVKFAQGKEAWQRQMPACQILCRWTHYYSSEASRQTSQAWGYFTVAVIVQYIRELFKLKDFFFQADNKCRSSTCKSVIIKVAYSTWYCMFNDYSHGNLTGWTGWKSFS